MGATVESGSVIGHGSLAGEKVAVPTQVLDAHAALEGRLVVVSRPLECGSGFVWKEDEDALPGPCH